MQRLGGAYHDCSQATAISLVAEQRTDESLSGYSTIDEDSSEHAVKASDSPLESSTKRASEAERKVLMLEVHAAVHA